MADPRGLRNRNPGNIRHGAVTWQGAAKEQPDPAFVTFTSDQFGIRALAKVLLTYQNQRDLDTVRKIIGRWAPPNENDTEAYVAAVANGMAVGPDQPLDIDAVGMMLPLVKAIIAHENGAQPYSDAVLMEGLRMAGVSDAKPKPLISSKQFLTSIGSVATSGGVAAVALNDSVVAPVSRALAPYADHNSHVGAIIATLAGVSAALAASAVIFNLLQRKATGA